ncbi:MAG: NYN domain-containing protein [Myxococcaceae bacterium]
MDQKTSEHRIALFLDFENLVTNTGISPAKFDLRPALDRLLEKGKVVFRRAYCDWSRFREATRGLHDVGVELTDVPPSTRAGKNAADMRLVIDALELCYAREHIDTFAIASGDSDFCPLAYKLRENNRTVIGIGVKEATSPLFVRACDEFIYLRPGSKPESALPVDEASRKAGGAGGRRGGRRTGGHGRSGERAPGPGRPAPEVPQIAREVVSSLLGRATEPLNPSLIKETIVRMKPDFDERDHGFSSFSKLLGAMQDQGLLKLQQLHGRQWYVTAHESAAHPAPPAGEAHEAADPDGHEQEHDDLDDDLDEDLDSASDAGADSDDDDAVDEPAV